jgi:hypothetical protein
MKEYKLERFMNILLDEISKDVERLIAGKSDEEIIGILQERMEQEDEFIDIAHAFASWNQNFTPDALRRHIEELQLSFDESYFLAYERAYRRWVYVRRRKTNTVVRNHKRKTGNQGDS